jgi:hypothetical protein
VRNGHRLADFGLGSVRNGHRLADFGLGSARNGQPTTDFGHHMAVRHATAARRGRDEGLKR